MPNPAPIYVVEYAGDQLAGYAQTEERPLSFRGVENTYFGRSGGTSKYTGTGFRPISLEMLVMSRLDNNATGLQHLEDANAQYEETLNILANNPEMNELFIHSADRVWLARPENISAQLTARSARRYVYTVRFIAQPYAAEVDPTPQTFSGNDTLTFDVEGSVITYPIFVVGEAVDEFHAADNSGHLLEFVRTPEWDSEEITIDCGSMLVLANGDDNAIANMQSLDFGLHSSGGDTTYDIEIDDFAGSGLTTVTVPKRFTW